MSALDRVSFKTPTQTTGSPNRPSPTTSAGLKQPSINNGRITRSLIQTTTHPCHFTSTVRMIPYATTPPRHRLRISTRTRRTAGRPSLVAKVGAIRLAELAGRVAVTRKLLLAPLSALLHQQLPPTLKLVVKVAGRAAAMQAVKEVG